MVIYLMIIMEQWMGGNSKGGRGEIKKTVRNEIYGVPKEFPST
jgi:hypothetical protein